MSQSLSRTDDYLLELCYVWDELDLEQRAEVALSVTAKAWPKMAKRTKMVIAGYVLLACVFLGLLFVATAKMSGTGEIAWVGWVFLAGAGFGALLMLLARK